MAVALREINKIEPKEKPFMVAVDGEDNLYVEIFPTGRKSWKFRTMRNGKSFKMTLGNFDTLHISEIRNRAKELEVKLYRGEPLKTKQEPTPPPEMKFKELAERYMENQTMGYSENYLKGLTVRLKKYINPVIGDLELSEITSKTIIDFIEKIQNPPSNGDPIFENARRAKEKDECAMFETASRIKKQIGQIMRYAKNNLGEIQNDPTSGIRLARPRKAKVKHFAHAKNTTEIAKLINAIYRYDFAVVRGLLLFNLLTFVRPVEAREAKWSDINWEQKHWIIPAETMKGGLEHLVPLSTQSLQILEEMKIHRRDDYIFPSGRIGRTISDGTARQALRACGYHTGEMTVHGFRHTASTALNGTRGRIRTDVIEFQLAHLDHTTRGTYNMFEYETERIEMMQYWADFLWELITP